MQLQEWPVQVKECPKFFHTVGCELLRVVCEHFLVHVCGGMVYSECLRKALTCPEVNASDNVEMLYKLLTWQANWGSVLELLLSLMIMGSSRTKFPSAPVVCHVHLDWSSYMPLCCIRRWAFWFWSHYRFHLLKQSKWCTSFYLGRSMVFLPHHPTSSATRH